MVSMKDIAEKLNLSRTTISNILNNNLDKRSYKQETIDEVIATAKEMGYIPNDIAKSLKTGTTKTIAIVVPDIANDFYVGIIKNIESLANEVDYSLIICITEESLEKENKAINILKSRMVDGILIAPVSYTESLLDSQYPFKIVCFDRVVTGNRFPFVSIDNENVAAQLTTKLLETPAENPLFLAGSRSDYTVALRLKGYRKALSEKGLAYNPNNIIYDVYDDNIAYEKLNAFILKNGDAFDSVFLSTNYFIYGVLESLSFNGIKDIPLGGFENFKGSKLVNTKILKVEQPEIEIANLAFDNLLSLLNNKKVKNSVLKTTITE